MEESEQRKPQPDRRSSDKQFRFDRIVPWFTMACYCAGSGAVILSIVLTYVAYTLGMFALIVMAFRVLTRTL